MFVPPVGHFGKVVIVAARDWLGGVRSGPRSPNQAFEQRRAGQAIGAVQPGAGHFARRAQPVHRGSAAIVGGNAAAAIVRRGNHRDGLAREVDAALDAHRVDSGKTLAKLVGGLVSDVQVNARLARFQHGLVNGARGDVARRQRPVGMELVHEFLPVTIHQPTSLSAHRFGNQEAAIRRQQRGRVELDVLHVDAAGAGPVGHRNAIAARPGGIRRVQEDAAQTAGGKNGFLGQQREDLLCRPVEHVCPDAGQQAIDVGGLERVVRDG